MLNAYTDYFEDADDDCDTEEDEEFEDEDLTQEDIENYEDTEREALDPDEYVEESED